MKDFQEPASRTALRAAAPTMPKLGRPARSLIEEVRVAVWFATVMRTSPTKTTAELERRFGGNQSAVNPARRPSRWSKYRYGKTSPPLDLVDIVGKRHPESKYAYGHPLWELAASTALAQAELRDLILRIGDYGDRLCDRVYTKNGATPFWLPTGFNHRTVIAALLQDWPELRLGGVTKHLDRTAAFVALSHDAVNRQRQAQHFEAHLALASHGARSMRGGPGLTSPWPGKLEAILLERWLSTEYRHAHLRMWMDRYRQVDFGKVHERRLKLVVASPEPDPGRARRESSRKKIMRGRWIMETIEKSPPELTWPADI